MKNIPQFPIFLNLNGKSCLVIGGAEPVAQKVEQLLYAGAEVLLVAKKIAAEERLVLEQMEGLTILLEPWHPDHFDNIWFVISTLTDHEENSKIEQEAERRCIFLNIVDQTKYCSAIFPAVLRDFPVTAAFSTAGASPALAGYLRRWLGRNLPEKLGDIALWLRDWRQPVAVHIADLAARGVFWRTLMDNGLLEKYSEDSPKAADEMVERALIKHKKE